MKACLLLLILGLSVSCQPKRTFDVSKLDKQYIRSFDLPACEGIIIEYYPQMSNIDDHVPPVKSRTIVDGETIVQILTTLRRLPDEGQIMKKMGNASLLQVTCVNGTAAPYFEFYDGSLKTPATSFYANHPPEEKELYELLTSLLDKQ